MIEVLIKTSVIVAWRTCRFYFIGLFDKNKLLLRGEVRLKCLTLCEEFFSIVIVKKISTVFSETKSKIFMKHVLWVKTASDSFMIEYVHELYIIKKLLVA